LGNAAVYALAVIFLPVCPMAVDKIAFAIRHSSPRNTVPGTGSGGTKLAGGTRGEGYSHPVRPCGLREKFWFVGAVQRWVPSIRTTSAGEGNQPPCVIGQHEEIRMTNQKARPTEDARQRLL